MVEINGSVKDLLDQPVLYNLATVNPNGSIQVNPVWGDIEDGRIVINTAVGRQKHKNLVERGDRITVMVQDPSDTQRYIEIRGKVSELTEANGDEVIDRLAKKYLGVDTYPYRSAEETRVTIVIEPTKVFGE